MKGAVTALLCISLAGCAASRSEVKARLGQEYIGQNVDTLVLNWGPPATTFRLNSGQQSYVWQLSSVTEAVGGDGYATARTIGCKVTVVASPAGVITNLDTEDHNPGGTGVLGLAGSMGAFGSMCAHRLGMKREQS